MRPLFCLRHRLTVCLSTHTVHFLKTLSIQWNCLSSSYFTKNKRITFEGSKKLHLCAQKAYAYNLYQHSEHKVNRIHPYTPCVTPALKLRRYTTKSTLESSKEKTNTICIFSCLPKSTKKKVPRVVTSCVYLWLKLIMANVFPPKKNVKLYFNTSFLL